ncbi:MAG TPA: DUF3160 domain-containing protein [Opitutaceae bacterium]|nr:DUF3160 domain-containing protein [Opitutaceae bacterium]
MPPFPHGLLGKFGVSTVVLCFFGGLALAAPAPSQAPAAPATTGQASLPPEPLPPRLRGLTPEQQGEAEEQYRRVISAWDDSLTKGQVELRYKQQSESYHKERRELSLLPSSAQGYTWQSAAQIAQLSDEEIAHLGRDKILIEDRMFSQWFQAYTEPQRSVFITSDSILNAFHVLFEDSFRELELRRSPQLRKNLEIIVEQARENFKSSGYPADATAPGWRQAQLVVGPALRLLGTPLDFFDADVRQEIERQVAKIRAAEAVELPEWLGPPSATLIALDYRRCRPVGFYAGTPRLADYFRAVRWLQMVPFRADRDNELSAICFLGYGLNANPDSTAKYFFDQYNALIGLADERDLSEAAYEFQNLFSDSEKTWKDKLFSLRQWLLRDTVSTHDFRKLCDSMRLPPNAGDNLAEIQLHVLSASRLPDAVLFQQLANDGASPEGLAVATMLGSTFAKKHITNIPADKLAKALAAAQRERAHKSHGWRQQSALYEDYLRVLDSLFMPPDSSAPDFMHNEAWAAKSCQTALAGWAQMRHALTLQSKLSEEYLGLTEVPPGFVEPNPVFFDRLAGLIQRTSESLYSAGAFTPTEEYIAERLSEDAAFLEALGFDKPGAAPSEEEKLNLADQTHYREVIWEDKAYLHSWKEPTSGLDSPAEFQSYFHNLIAAFREEADRYERGEGQLDPRDTGARERWVELERSARRLEALAYKQLRQQLWTDEETDFIKAYGKIMAGVMGYAGNSWLTPLDDAPRWVEVHANPNTDTSLAVGIGRPRLIHVLYPWNGTEILCQGAVMAYYEYPSKQRLTDGEWLQLLDSKKAPPLPDWIAPYFAK